MLLPSQLPLLLLLLLDACARQDSLMGRDVHRDTRLEATGALH
jgi:hypothetical protein